MAKAHPGITDELKSFIEMQKMFFVGTAAATGRVNISPKGMDSLRVLGNDRVAWLNLTGSGNETSAHIQLVNRMTLMFCAFAGEPLILRLYGSAREVARDDKDWETLASCFPDYPGMRQIYDMAVDLVITSCGFSVPEYHYAGERDTLVEWANRKGEQGVCDYWEKNNRLSLDGYPTRLGAGSTDKN